jgi:L-aspartate oxidase
MAYRAGAELRNLEFVQFHPTCLYHPDAKSFLISEAVRGEGAVLVDAAGRRFMPDYHEMGDLAPRDVVARSIDRELKRSGEPCAWLDLTHLDPDRVRQRFPHLVEVCARFGIEMAGGKVPVVPAAHYMCGGVRVDLDARSDLPGLFVIGEAACTGVHGANRLASNSLLEAVFFAARAAAALADEPVLFAGPAPVLPDDLGPGDSRTIGTEVMILEHDWDLVRRVMWDYVGIVRDRERLDIALERLRAVRQTVEDIYRGNLINPDVVELRNIALLGELIVLCARSRRESRGLHYTSDHPAKAAVAADTVIRRGVTLEGETSLELGRGDR